MKLKKIASLALAGIMAVSMLTACGEGGKKEEDNSASSDVTTVSGAAEALNAALLQNKDVIQFENDSELDKDLEAYYRANPIMGDEWNLSKTYEIVKSNNSDLNKFIDVTHSDWTNFSGMIQDKTSTSYPDSRAVVGMFNADIFTKADALKVVGTEIDGLTFESDKSNTTDGKEFVYTGKASVIEVESEKGAASVWVVVAVVEKDYTTI